MSNTGAMQLGMIESMRKHWGWFLALGVVFVIGGMLAIFAPLVSSLAVTLVVAIVLGWVGLMQVIQAFSVKSWGGFIWQLIIGLIILIGGIWTYVNPVVGALTLTIVVAAVFLAKGVFQVILGFQMRPHSGWGWLIASGVLAIIVGLMIWMNWPFSGTWVLGTLAGISLIFTGWSYIMISMVARRV